MQPRFSTIPFYTVRRKALVGFCLLLNTVFVSLSAQAFRHPGILHNEEDLSYIRQKLAEGAQPWKAAFDSLKASPYASLSYKATPVATVACGSYNNPNEGCNQQVEDAMAAYSHALLWCLTGEKAHADKGAEIIDAWTAVYQQNTLSNARLVVSWTTPWLVNAAELLRYSNAGWAVNKQARFEALLQKLLPYVVDETMPGNNWVQSAVEAHLAIAVYTNDKALFDRGVERWRYRVRTYVYQQNDGAKPLNPPGKSDAQTAAIWKTTGANPVDGIAMETCRDLGHLNLGFRSLVYAAQTAWQQGVDLFQAEQKRLADFMELHAAWMTGKEAVPPGICGGTILAKRTDSTGIKPPHGGGQAAWELAYSQLHHRLKIPLPHSAKMIAANRPAKLGRWVTKAETLTHSHPPGTVQQNSIKTHTKSEK